MHGPGHQDRVADDTVKAEMGCDGCELWSPKNQTPARGLSDPPWESPRLIKRHRPALARSLRKHPIWYAGVLTESQRVWNITREGRG
jgi:hypothetical protein